MKLPYLLLVEADADRREIFATVFEQHIAYATVVLVNDGQSSLSFLSSAKWSDLPTLIILSHQLADITIANLLRELLMDQRYLAIPKIVWIEPSEKKEIAECTMLGIKHFRNPPINLVEIEREVRLIDKQFKMELNFL